MAEVLLLDHTDCTTGDHQTVDRTIQYNRHHPADENPMRLAERTKHRRQNGNFFQLEIKESLYLNSERKRTETRKEMYLHYGRVLWWHG